LPIPKTGKPDHLVLITNQAVDQALESYRKRWTIEVFFQSLKGRGFDLEASHLGEAHKMKKLFALYCGYYTHSTMLAFQTIPQSLYVLYGETDRPN
ncbi:MAG: hypothetical protein AAF599_05715, partial [Bacteroidota bacterium]